MKARVSQLHKTEAEWQKLASWTPEAGEIVIYDPDTEVNYPRVKIGDGKTSLKNLSFFIDDSIKDYLKQYKYQEIIDGGRITDYI